MAKKKFKSPWKVWSSYTWAFLVVSTFVSLIFSANILFNYLNSNIVVCQDSCSNLVGSYKEDCNSQCNALQSGVENNFQFLKSIYDLSDNMKIVYSVILLLAGFGFGYGIYMLRVMITGEK